MQSSMGTPTGSGEAWWLKYLEIQEDFGGKQSSSNTQLSNLMNVSICDPIPAVFR